MAKQQSERNDYGDLVETWKVELIVERARRKGVRKDDLEDAQQEVIRSVLRFQYDPAKSNGATEATALTALIDNHLTFLQRGAARRSKNHERYLRSLGIAENKPLPEPTGPDYDRLHGLVLDVREAVAKLTPAERAVCDALSLGIRRHRIAKELHLSRYGVDLMVKRIRDRFAALGLGDWVGA
jgi:DNA-binding NarL/FixJ family response regulator